MSVPTLWDVIPEAYEPYLTAAQAADLKVYKITLFAHDALWNIVPWSGSGLKGTAKRYASTYVKQRDFALAALQVLLPPHMRPVLKKGLHDKLSVEWPACEPEWWSMMPALAPVVAPLPPTEFIQFKAGVTRVRFIPTGAKP